MFTNNNLIQENIMKNDWRITRFAKVLDAIEELESVICHALDIDLGDDMIKPLEVLKDNVKEAEVEETEMVRARNEKGHYIADDPNTPENEAWTTRVVKKIVGKS